MIKNSRLIPRTAVLDVSSKATKSTIEAPLRPIRVRRVKARGRAGCDRVFMPNTLPLFKQGDICQ